MKSCSICMIASGDTWGGAETQVLSLATELSREKGLRVVSVCFNEGILRERLRRAGVEVHLFDEKRGFSRLVYLVGTLIRKERFDIIHVHGHKEHLVAGIAHALGSGFLVRTFHGRGLIPVRRYRITERIASIMLGTVPVAVSHELKGYLEGQGFRNVAVIHNGLAPSGAEDVPPQELTHPWNLPGPVVGTVGRLVNVKDHALLLRSARRVLSQRGDVSFVLVGDGPLKEDLRRQAEDLSISDRVIFTGFRGDAAHLAGQFDLFVLCSRHEGVPIALLEAMRASRPIVATAVGGITEILEDMQEGILVPPGDEEALARGMIRVLEDRHLAKRLGENAARKANGVFSSTACAEKYRSLFEELIH